MTACCWSLSCYRSHGLSDCECGGHACFDMTVLTVFGFCEFHAAGNCCVIWRWCAFGNAVQIWWHFFTDTYIPLPTFDACLVLKSFSSSSFTIRFNPLFPLLHCRCVCQCLKVMNAYAPCQSRAILWFFSALQVSASLFTEVLGAYARQEWLVWWKESKACILKLSTWTELVWAHYFMLLQADSSTFLCILWLLWSAK
jgi:hypothetical protein